MTPDEVSYVRSSKIHRQSCQGRTVQEHLDHRLVVSISRFQPISEAAYACSLESCLLSSRPPSHFLAALITQIRHSELLVYRRERPALHSLLGD